MAKISIESFIQSRWFLQGLPPLIQAELSYASDLDPGEDLERKFQELLQKTMKIVELKKKLGGLVRSDGEDSLVSDLVDRCNHEAIISYQPNVFAPLSDSSFGPPFAASSTYQLPNQRTNF